ncbi:MAG TPA: copper resistance CopC family protein [Steroidobacteraceae bacterium]|jgi:methionine-rich copper-binding protein CopC|nr:copper resistance CopC family protein [Steroidobacteraceae bacterium]
MKRLAGVFGVWALLAAGAVYAHAHLLQATPADGSVLTQAPTAFALKFNEAATLTALTLQKGAQAAQKIEGLPTKPSALFSIPAPKLDAGDYTLNFRVLSDDNHVVSGSIKFKVNADK